jgi:hypothetical protein
MRIYPSDSPYFGNLREEIIGPGGPKNCSKMRRMTSADLWKRNKRQGKKQD